MHALTICVVGLVWFYLGYRFYGRFISSHLAPPDPERSTPAHSAADGVDYAASPAWMLWGNHFASIAGAGPIIGPILACSIFGWGPTLLWVAVGSVFMGAVHDYMALMLSVRRGGRGVDAVAGEALGGGVRMVFALLLFFMLLLLITVFMVSVAEAFINVPELVIPTFGLVLIAMGMGWLVPRHHIDGRVVGAWGVFLAYGLIWVGNSHPVSLPQEWGPQVVLAVWFAAISAYCLLASVAPIWLILRPRDCISTAKLFIGMLLGFAGLAVARPLMQAPFSTGSFLAGGKPMWPMLFIIVACGAISGFHAVVSTGTTARQLDHEADARPIAFGGMVMEGVLAMLVLLVVAGGLKWGEAPAGVTGRAAELYFATALQENWIVAFGSGFGNLVSKLGIPYLGYAVAALLGSVMVKSFVLTTLDTGTRLARFLVSDGLGARVPLLRGKVAASLVILVPAYVLAVTHSYGSIWRLFGSANQLTAAITLLTATALLGRAKRPTLFTLVPAGFMLATSLAALVWEMFAPGSGSFTAPEKDWLLGAVSLVLLALGVAACIGYWRGVQSAPRAQGMNPLTFKRD